MLDIIYIWSNLEQAYYIIKSYQDFFTIKYSRYGELYIFNELAIKIKIVLAFVWIFLMHELFQK